MTPFWRARLVLLLAILVVLVPASSSHAMVSATYRGNVHACNNIYAALNLYSPTWISSGFGWLPAGYASPAPKTMLYNQLARVETVSGSAYNFAHLEGQTWIALREHQCVANLVPDSRLLSLRDGRSVPTLTVVGSPTAEQLNHAARKIEQVPAAAVPMTDGVRSRMTIFTGRPAFWESLTASGSR